MRPTGSGPLSALLVLAPLVALPILAVVGIPQFAGGNLIDSQNSVTNSATRKGAGASESRSGEAARSDADDLFAPLGKSADGFDDPLRRTKKKSRSRTSRNDFESDFENVPADDEDLQDSVTGSRSKSRPRGKSSAFSNTGDDETQDQDFDSDQGSATASSRGTRPSSRGLNRNRQSEDDFADETELTPTGDELEPDAVEGEQYADNGSDFSSSSKTTKARGNQFADNPSKRQQRSPDDADLALFESPPPKSNRNTPKSSNGIRPTGGRTRPVDPNDAPPFQPSGNSASAGGADTEPDAEEPPPETSLRKQSQRSQPMASLPDVTDEAIASRNAAPTAPAANMSQEQSLKDLFDSLKAAGMVPESHHFVYVEESDTFLFTCRASRGGNSPPQKFEEEANEPLLAVYKVLKRVQSWQAKSSKKVRPAQ